MPDTETQVPENAVVAEGTESLPAAEAGSEPKVAQAEPEKPQSTEVRQKAPEYDVVQSKREMPETGYIAHHAPVVVEGAVASGQNPAGAAKVPQARLSQAPVERIKKFATSPTRVYAATGIGLGLLVGLIVAVTFLHPTPPGGPFDMGSVNVKESGLKGHLTTGWNGHLTFRVTVEPADASQRAAFQKNVVASPIPLSVNVQAKDPFGAVLCGDTVLVKFDPRNGPGGAVAEPDAKASKAEKEAATRNSIAHGVDLARLEGQELGREHGKDVFQNDVGPDGHVASISAQGILPCTRKQFESIASWGFTGNFPAAAPLARSQNLAAIPDVKEESNDKEPARKSADTAKSAANEKAKRKPAPPLPPIYIEGDDAILWIDAANGTIETRDGKVLSMDKTDTLINSLKGRDLPIPIHYRCDQSGFCTFGGRGTGLHRARVKR